MATEMAPGAVGPYSQAIRTTSFVFTAGQIGLDPNSGRLVAGGIDAQTRQALLNLDAVLRAAGSGLAAIVKTTVFLTDMTDFRPMNEVYETFFKAEPPARSTVAVAGLPLNALVEIEAVALVES